MMKDIGDLCTHCFRDTSFGSGLYINRIGSETEDYSGYMCIECRMEDCERCGARVAEFGFTSAGELLCESCGEIHNRFPISKKDLWG